MRVLLAAGVLAVRLAVAPTAAGQAPGDGPRLRVAAAPRQVGPTARPVRIDGRVCREQAPQRFLMRSSYTPTVGRPMTPAMARASVRALRYRMARYGHVPGHGRAAWNPVHPGHRARWTTFFGLPLRMHGRVIPALRCVEKALRRDCRASPYQPRVLIGIRFRASFTGGEVSNHRFGIAVDIDPSKNTCCRCVPPFSDHPACRRPSARKYVLPECWIDTFERYGFYWLGHDVLKDTMHFEFLADPDRILEP